MKLREIRESYEDTSRTFSSSVRNLAISGIAIAWLFATGNKYDEIPFTLVGAITLFVITLFADLFQNYNLSVSWYKFYRQIKSLGKKEDDEVNEPENYNKWGWRMYKAKPITLFLGYVLILVNFFL